MVLLSNDEFLTQLTLLAQSARAESSFTLTIKRSLQEMCWEGAKPGTGFIVLGKMRGCISDCDRMCRLRIKSRPLNFHIFYVHFQHEKSSDDEKLYSCPHGDVKIVLGDMNARIRREDICKPVIPHKRQFVCV